MDYNQAMQQIQAMQMYRRMLGLDQAQGGYGQPQSQMQYAGMAQPGQQQGTWAGGGQSGGGSSLSSVINTYKNYNNLMKMFSGPQSGGMAGAGTGGGGLYGTTASLSTPAGTGMYGTGTTLSGNLGGLYGTGVGSNLPASQLAPVTTQATDVAGAGSSSYLGYAAPILAAIAGQHMMSGATDRRTMEGGKSGTKAGEGHRTGDVFSGDFFTEPWMAWGEQQLGVDTPTAGEKTDAAIDRMREGKGGFSDFMSTVPGTAYQWFDPVGNFAGDVMGDKFGDVGKALTMMVLPHTGLKWGADWLSGLF